MRGTLRVGDSSARVAEVRSALARIGLIEGYEGELGDWNTRQFSKQEMLFDEALAETLRAFAENHGTDELMLISYIDDVEVKLAQYGELAARLAG